MDKKDQPLVKKDFEKILVEALSDQAKTIIDAVDFGFNNAKRDRAKIKSDIVEIKSDIVEIKEKLRSLERRIIFIENVITRHTKEVKAIRQELSQIKNSLKNSEVISKDDYAKAMNLEKRVEKLEMAVA